MGEETLSPFWFSNFIFFNSNLVFFRFFPYLYPNGEEEIEGDKRSTKKGGKACIGLFVIYQKREKVDDLFSHTFVSKASTLSPSLSLPFYLKGWKNK